VNLLGRYIGKGPVAGKRRIVMEQRATQCVHGVSLNLACEDCRLALNPPMRQRIEAKKPTPRRRKT
jgi:hypothetical protein